jgi:hypothetical protein
VCCHKAIQVQDPYYLSRRDLRGETFGEWFGFLANLYNIDISTVYQMYEEYKIVNNIDTSKTKFLEHHKFNSQFESTFIKTMKMILKIIKEE